MSKQTSLRQFATREHQEETSLASTSSSEKEESTKSAKVRGTRIIDGALHVSGARNHTARDIVITKGEILEDVVDRGLRVSGLARKLGISDKGKTVRTMMVELFKDDDRKTQMLEALSVKQGKKNNNYFEALTREEIKVRHMLCILVKIFRQRLLIKLFI